MRGTGGGAGTVTGGGIKRHRDHHDPRVVRSDGKTEETVAGSSGIGVETSGDE